MSARPFRVGDHVLIDGSPGKVWHVAGPNPDNQFNGDFATAYIDHDEPNEAGADATAVIMTPDLTASKYQHRTLVLAGDSPADLLDLQAIGAETIAEFAPEDTAEARARRMFPIGTRVVPAPNFGEIGTRVPLADLGGTIPDAWTDENTFVIRWDGEMGHVSIHNAETIMESVRVAEESDDDGTEAEALAPVEVPRQHHAEPVGDLRPRWSQAGVMSVRGDA